MASYIFQKPWLWSDLASSYYRGSLVISNALLPTRKINVSQLVLPLYLFIDTYFLARSLSAAHQALTAKSVSYTLIALYSLNLGITQVMEGDPKENSPEFVIWNYTPKVLAIMNAALIILDTKERPMRTFAYTVTVVTRALDYYRKLPSRISQVWDYMPWACHALNLYDGDRISAVVAISRKVLQSYRVMPWVNDVLIFHEGIRIWAEIGLSILRYHYYKRL
ncbi:MAG: hypothetical protein KBA81_05310 [Rhabdochlamydiaceae bacterium]|nr:hypothetical protein [Rhabdochlamydiaceae bacterium]